VDPGCRSPGFLTTLLFVVLSIFPIINVGTSWKYSVKIAVVVLGANVLGYTIFRANSIRNTASE